MKIEYFNASDFAHKLKVTVQKTGKLGFTDDTARKLNLSEKSFVKLGKDIDSKDLLLCNNPKDPAGAFNVHKAGKYYYISAKGVFDALGMDYRSDTIIFDMVDASEEYPEAESEVYKLIRRIKVGKGKQINK